MAMSDRWRAMPLGWTSTAVLVLSSLIGLMAFLWPFFVSPDSGLGHNRDAPLLFAATLAMVVLVLLAEIARGGIDSRALALLAVLTAVGAALRPLGGGLTGFQPMLVVFILGGRALGPGFGFMLGLLATFASALLTGGVGPWLPFQMLAGGWLAMGAGLLPALRGRAEVIMLAVYGAVSSVLYGFALNLWFWPFATNPDSAIAFVAGDQVVDNLQRFFAFNLVTSLGFDIPRAIGTAVLVMLLGGALLRSMRRASRRAAFGDEVSFEPAAS